MHFPTYRKAGDFADTESEPDDQVLNRQHYLATKITPSVDIGLPYPGCTQEDLKELDHVSQHWQSKWHPRHIRQATEELCDFLKQPPSANAQAAISRLDAAWNSKKWSPEIAIKCFPDLDKAYFGGYLKRKIRLRFKGSTQALYESLGPAYKGTFGVTCCPYDDAGVPVARIILNAQMIFLNPRAASVDGSRCSRKRQTFGTLVHEMIHAFLFIRAGHPHDRDEDARGLDGGHGRSFQTCAWAITKRTEKDLKYEVYWNERYHGTGHGQHNLFG